MKLNCRSAQYGVQAFAVIAFAVACEGIVDPPLPVEAVAFAPPPVYAKWWAMTESCSGVSRSLSGVSWYVVPRASQFKLRGQTVTGYWTEASNSIILADSSQLDGSVVRHEMLHALIKGIGHPRSAFLEKCAGVVSCTAECVADGGPPPTSAIGFPVVPSDSIDVSIQLVPDPPSITVDGGVFSLVVTARNPASHPVSVLLPGNPGGGPLSFAFQIRAFAPGSRVEGTLLLSDPSINTFAAGETKRQYFDFVIGNVLRNRTVTPGQYRITGSYGNRTAVITPVTILAP